MACLTVAVLAASEHHGQVTFGTLPVPGATVTITQGDKKFVAITDPKGAYAFPDLPDGTWNVRVEMLCFSTINSDVVIGASAPDAIWELKLLPFAEIQAAAGPKAPKPTPRENRCSPSRPRRCPSSPINACAGQARRKTHPEGEQRQIARICQGAPLWRLRRTRPVASSART